MIHSSGNWDLPSLNYRNPVLSSSNGSNNTPLYDNNSMLNTPLGRVYTAPPPVPARPNRNTFSSGYNTYASPFSSYGSYLPSYGSYGGYGGYGGYGSYGGFGFGGYRPGFNSYGPLGSGPENRFIQVAEESSRPAFQSIQSVLQAFSSVTMMFESSFHAIYSSYMSVLGVANNLANLRTVLGQIFSTFAFIRSLGWLYKRILYLLGINRDTIEKDCIWSEALSGVSDTNLENASEKKRTWSTLLFLGIIFGGPYLLFKLLSELYPSPVPKMWVPADQPGSLAVGLYDFHAASDQELSFSAQQKLMIAPKKFQPLDCPGWLLACNENQRIGLVPNNYVGIIMQSEKTGQTFIKHNGRTYEHPIKSSDISENSRENNQKTVNENDFKAEVSEKASDGSES